MKTIALVLLISASLISLVHINNTMNLMALSNQEIIQEFLNGLFEANMLPRPTTIVPCIDDQSAAIIVNSAPQILYDAGHLDLKNIDGLKNEVKAVVDGVTPQTKQCLDGNAELEALGVKFGITPDTDTSKLETKVITYVSLHYFAVEKSVNEIGAKWNNKEYYAAGVLSSELGHKILGNNSFIKKNKFLQSVGADMGTNQIILQKALDGVSDQNALPHTTFVEICIPESQATLIVAFIPVILHKAGRASIANINDIKNEVEAFGKTLDPSVGDCLDNNPVAHPQVEQLGNAFGINDQTDKAKLEKRVISYLTLHLLAVEDKIRKIEDQWNAGDYYGAGVKGSDLGHQVLGN